MNRVSLILLALVLVVASAHAWSFTEITSTLDNQPESASTVAWGDVDNDGDMDLFVGGVGTDASFLYSNDHGTLVDVSEAYGLRNTDISDVLQAQWIDYDSDGDLDLSLIVGNSSGFALLENTDLHFDQQMIALDQEFDSPVRSAFWTNVNQDNLLDLVVSNGPGEGGLFTVMVQEADEFIPMRANPFEDNMTDVGAITQIDYDRDGILDVCFGNLSGTSGWSKLYHGRPDGSFENLAPHFEFPQKFAKEGAVWFDFNNDQRWDFYAPGEEAHSRLLRGLTRDGHSVLKQVNMNGLMPAGANGRFAHAIDVNLDGWTDLFVVKSNDNGCALMLNRGGQNFVDVADEMGLDFWHNPNQAAAWADFDGDGDLDLALAQDWIGVRIFRNDLVRQHEYVMLNLVDEITGMPVANCEVFARFDNWKSISTTSRFISTPGCDDSRVLIVNGDDRKSDELDLTIRWGNGVVQTMTRDAIRMKEVNTFVQPALVPNDSEPIAGPAEILHDFTISPNPFNPVTTIHFTLAEAVPVRLTVFNLLGQEVAMLANGSYQAGEHRIAFNGSDLPSGLYFTRLTAGSTTIMNRMLLAK